MLDVLKLVKGTGLGGRQLYAYVSVNPHDHDQVRTSHFLFGGLYVGLNLPVTAQDQAVWDFLPDKNGSEAGSWGGHAVNLLDTSAKTLTVATWGQLQKMTWSFWEKYVDECWAVLDADFVGADKVSPQGFSLAKLAADIKAI